MVLVACRNRRRGPFHIDHVSLNYPNNGSDGMIQIWGPIYGLIDHSDFSMQYEAAIITGRIMHK